jgi:hypothetical protein
MRSSLSLPESNEYVRNQSARSDRPPPIKKESVKLNVESINDRFISSLLIQEKSGKNGRLSTLFPAQIKNGHGTNRQSQRKIGPLKPLTDARRRQISFSSDDLILKSRDSFSF